MGQRLLKVGFTLLLLFFLVDRAISSNDYINSRCNAAVNYTAGSKFEANMRRVFFTLTNLAPPIGFGFATWGQGLDRVYGLVQCRGDIDQEDCKACIHNSTQAVVDTYCPSAVDAIIWYENCQLRYSNTKFFARLNVEDSGFWYWVADKVIDPKVFNEKLGSLLKNLTYLATIDLSRLMFVTGYIPYSDLQTIYVLVQCTWDTSLADCKLCLDNTTSLIQTTCKNAHGCEIVTGSCRVRYDTQLFYAGTPTVSLSPPSNSPSPSNSSPSPSPPFDSPPPEPPSPSSNGSFNTTSG
ncbi:cysteine-rich repeat secretory protein 38-like [Nymphaea colorata]|nr:cysteine-rich repeat secretory protein 38-like [Nymphaea colorata]